jgi:(2R)-sulfolactate sulfo-lyase subunit alpha
MTIPHLLVHSRKDNVGVVVVEGLPAAKQGAPIGHKIALKDLKKGDTIFKYGEDIGRAVADIAKGEHVHVHNIKTKRW